MRRPIDLQEGDVEREERELDVKHKMVEEIVSKSSLKSEERAAELRQERGKLGRKAKGLSNTYHKRTLS